MNPFYFLIALFFKWIISKPYSSFVMFQCFKPAVSLLRHWCRKQVLVCVVLSLGVCYVCLCFLEASAKQSGVSMMWYVNVCSLNIIPVLHHMPVPIFVLLTHCKPHNKLNVLSQVMWFSLVEFWGQLDAFSHVLFEFDNLHFSICQEGLSPSL